MKTLFDERPDREDIDATLLIRVVNIALRIATRSVREYSDKKSPKVFTQRQLLACLVLKTYLKTTYRGVVEQLVLMPAVREAIGLKQIPHTRLPVTTRRSAHQLMHISRASGPSS
ncbi:MAG: hypothetical protein IT435_17875 [Phycisphaerales bacterium]|nr:hypothetical protein [Phycisphaerales bacterium]